MPDAPLGADAIDGLAPDAAAAAAGRKLALPRHWHDLGRNDAAYWGRCQGSAVYQVVVAAPALECHCTCPSRKRPCKHALGLLYLHVAAPDALPVGVSAPFAEEWLAARAAQGVRADRRQIRRGARQRPRTAQGLAPRPRSHRPGGP